MKISHKLVGSFVSISLLTSVVGAVGIAQSQRIAENQATAEAEHVAQVLAISISHDEDKLLEVRGVHPPEELQNYFMQLYKLQKRVIEVVNRQKVVVADAVPKDIGTILEKEQANVVQKTMQDGLSRTFLEKNLDYPQGIKLIVVPLKTNRNQVDGAVILEWSSLYDSAMAQARPTMVVIGITSLGCLILALILGLRISSSIAKPLQLVTAVALQVSQESNFDLQAPVITQDETGILAIAFNHQIERMKTLLIEKEQRSTELQQALTQLRNTQTQLVQTEKMSSLGQLVAGVAHEINNPVSFIYGNISHIDSYTQDLLKLVQAYQAHYPNPPQTLQAILDDVELDFLNEDLHKLLQSMIVGTERIRQIVLSLRNFSRLDESEFKAVDLHEGIDNTLLILQHRFKATPESPAIEVVKNYSQLPFVECYAGQLNQVFMNLLANAIDTLKESMLGCPVSESNMISTGDQQQTNNNPQIRIATEVLDSNQVMIRFADNGCGMTEKVKQKIFDPFFTTKPVGSGTGLGMSISYKIIDQHGGQLKCISQPLQGTEFQIQIPIRSKSSAH